jgi:hypothetical protein
MLKRFKPDKCYFCIRIDEPFAKEIYEVLKRELTAMDRWPEGDIDFEEWKRQNWKENEKAKIEKVKSILREREACKRRSLN